MICLVLFHKTQNSFTCLFKSSNDQSDYYSHVKLGHIWYYKNRFTLIPNGKLSARRETRFVHIGSLPQHNQDEYILKVIWFTFLTGNIWYFTGWNITFYFTDAIQHLSTNVIIPLQLTASVHYRAVFVVYVVIRFSWSPDSKDDWVLTQCQSIERPSAFLFFHSWQRNDFNFHIIYSSFFHLQQPLSFSYHGLYDVPDWFLIWSCFILRARRLSIKLLKEEGIMNCFKSAYGKFYGRYGCRNP